MPITQARLITQTNAAFLSLEALNRIRSFIRTQSTYLSSGSMPHEQAYIELINFIENNSLLFPPTPAFAPDLSHIVDTYTRITHVVKEELQHFQNNSKRNEISAMNQRMFRDRSNPNRKQRRTSPHTLFESATLVQTSNQQPSARLTEVSKPIRPPKEFTEEEFNAAGSIVGDAFVPRSSKSKDVSRPKDEYMTKEERQKFVPEELEYEENARRGIVPSKDEWKE